MILPHLSRHNSFIIGKELKKTKKQGSCIKSHNKDAQIHNSFFKLHKKKIGTCFSWKEFSLIPSDITPSSGSAPHWVSGHTAALDRFLMGGTSFSVIGNNANLHKNAHCQMHCYYCLNTWLNRKALNRIHPFEITF